MTGADFCQFTGAFIQNIKEMRFVRYSALHFCCEIIDTVEGNNSRVSITFSKYCKRPSLSFCFSCTSALLTCQINASLYSLNNSNCRPLKGSTLGRYLQTHLVKWSFMKDMTQELQFETVYLRSTSCPRLKSMSATLNCWHLIHKHVWWNQWSYSSTVSLTFWRDLQERWPNREI